MIGSWKVTNTPTDNPQVVDCEVLWESAGWPSLCIRERIDLNDPSQFSAVIDCVELAIEEHIAKNGPAKDAEERMLDMIQEHFNG